MNINDEQIERYSRHIILQGVGGEGQEKLLNGKVLIIVWYFVIILMYYGMEDGRR